jgi:hypothetical protein
MSVRIPLTPCSNHTEACRGAKAVVTTVPKTVLIQQRDRAEIAMSLRQISDILDSGDTTADATDSDGIDRDVWVDDEYLYMDLAYSISDELMLDICVNRGRAFIRVSRSCLQLA